MKRVILALALACELSACGTYDAQNGERLTCTPVWPYCHTVARAPLPPPSPKATPSEAAKERRLMKECAEFHPDVFFEGGNADFAACVINGMNTPDNITFSINIH